MHRSIRLGLVLVAVVIAYSAVQYAYTLNNPVARWPVADIPVDYYVNPANGDGLEDAHVIKAVQDGANVWGAVPNATFSFRYVAPTTINQAVFDDDLDGDQDWTTSPCCDVVFFRDASNFNTIATTYTWVDSATHAIILASDTVFWDARMKFFTHSAGTCKRGYGCVRQVVQFQIHG